MLLSSPANDESSNAGTTTTDTAVEESEPNITATTFSLAEVAQHDTQDDCWTVIDDNVYDVTSYVKNHPGGEAILAVCGVDGTADFKNQGAPQDVADEIRTENNLPQDTEFHSPRARDVLRTLQIGVLAS